MAESWGLSRLLSTMVITGALSTLLWVLYIGFRAAVSPLRKLPGPWYSHFTHLRLKWAVLTASRAQYCHSMHVKYGSVVRLSPWEVGVSDLDSHRKIHGAGSKFYKSPWYVQLTNVETRTIFTEENHQKHAVRRKLFSRAFSKSYIREHWEEAVREKCWLAVSKIKRDALKGPTDILKWWVFLATDITGHLSFGESFNMLETEEKTAYVRCLDAALVGNGIGAELPWVRTILGNIPVAKLQEFFNVTGILDDYGIKAVENAKAQNGGKSIFAAILAEAEKENGRLTELDVKLEAVNIIVAGSETSAATLTYLVWAILQRPGLREEVEKEVAALPENFKDGDVESLPHLNACIEETLRLYGGLPGALPRITPQGGASLCGFYIPEGTTVCTQAYTMHRMPEHFEDPLSFKPERWLPGGSLSKEGKAAFTPFGAGSRMCVGVNVARMEIRYATTFFFRECCGARLAASVTPASMEFENFFSIKPKSHKCEIEL